MRTKLYAAMIKLGLDPVLILDHRKPLKLKLDNVLLALGLDLDDVQWDHRPPIQQRVWDPVKRDTVPPANAAGYLEPVVGSTHSDRTDGPKTKAVARGDKTEIAKTKRLAAAHKKFVGTILAKDEKKQSSRSIPSRPFPQGRSSFRKRQK
ncbi:hypothetical protein [Roseibium sp. Sym1]|uniref:hypothetical protein n=1 Tax=Roseibium sp. Sym1 TaxID=3016006 RepID=UPI0022B36C78|nr:hypothetical protein [Roseibium sp. Sym1]